MKPVPPELPMRSFRLHSSTAVPARVNSPRPFSATNNWVPVPVWVKVPPVIHMMPIEPVKRPKDVQLPAVMLPPD